MDYSKEEKLLITISRLHLEDNHKNKITELCKAPLNWDYLLKRAGEEGVDSLLYYHLKNNAVLNLIQDQSYIKKLSAKYYYNLTSNIHLLDEFYEILKRLHETGIQVILLKGVFLIERVYKNAGLRPMTDADVLVKKNAVPQIMKVMSDTDYHVTQHGHLGYLKDGKFPALIDFHWDIWFPETDDIWERCMGFAFRDIQAFALDNEDVLIYLSTHQSINHGMHKLIWLCDIHEFISKYIDSIDWEKFIRRVKGYSIEIPLYNTLSYSEKLLGTRIPSAVLEKLRPLKSNSFKARAFNKTTTNHYTVDVGNMFYLILLKGFRKRLTFLLRYVFPEKGFIEKRYSISSGYLGYIIRPFLLFFRGLKAIYQIIF